MKKHCYRMILALAMCATLGLLVSVPAAPALGSTVAVSQSGVGDITLVDDSDTKNTLASGVDRPFALKFDKHGNLFVVACSIDWTWRVYKIDPEGNVSTFVESLPLNRFDDLGRELELGYMDLTVSNDDKVFLLVRVYDPGGSSWLSEVWELAEPPNQLFWLLSLLGLFVLVSGQEVICIWQQMAGYFP